ncbi:PREDICTED: cation channel sperm-associated protein subunit beta-like [Gekko japonicus]|uniref:Cation channel sperm-associated protein subunit beta-like n=1 Tax=Gekko japonicus TaxID=146911 RepID=A0ABM1L9G5_GEKJA|nr:PREDICTED: cation channel sperm-associated protein subunit beta-like [Gekko japonicus]
MECIAENLPVTLDHHILSTSPALQSSEPILHWDFGRGQNFSELVPNVIGITITKSPCAGDVAIIGLILDDRVPGIYIGISQSAFLTQDTYWSNLTDSLCVVLEYDCADLGLLNIILTNAHLVLLTTLGLFISEDLRYGSFRALKFTRANFCGFERSDYYRAKIWYNIQCLANQEDYEVDYIAVSFNKDKTLSQESTCFYSKDPFMDWHSCLPHRKQADRLISRRVVSFMVDYQQNTGIGVLTQQDKRFVSVNKLTNHKLHEKTKFPEFGFPDAEFKAFGMLFHPNSHFLYVYGNQERDLKVSQRIPAPEPGAFISYYCVSADDLAFDGPLSLQYTTEEQIVFFSHVPSIPLSDHSQSRFHEGYIGKALEYEMGGVGIISKVSQHKYPPHFLSSVMVYVLERFPVETSASSPCIKNTLTILQPDPGTTAFKLQLSASGTDIFKASDIQKSIVILGFSSFLIVDVTGSLTALADATMPQVVPLNTPFRSGQWFMYDFGTTNGKRWKVVTDKCRYTMEQTDDLPVHAIKYMDLGSTRSFSFSVTPVNVAYRIFHMYLMEVKVGKPNLLDVNTAAYWDDNDSYTVKIRVLSKFFKQVNYRPPSRLGIAVPLTENFYNADPEKPRMRDYFQGSKTSGIYKQCANKTSRFECGCTDNMKLSFAVAFSDCKEKAIRMKYPVIKLPLSFTVENEDVSVNMSSPYFVTITEVNNRTNWEISGTNTTSSMLKMRKYLEHRLKNTLYNPDGLTLSIHGSELFHFRVAIIPGTSFCSLVDEFQIYVDDAPMAFPGDYLITSFTAVAVGFSIFVAFFLQAYEIQVWSILKQKLSKPSRVSPKFSLRKASTTSSDTSE